MAWVRRSLPDLLSDLFQVPARWIGYIIPLSTELQGYLNLKGYKEFGAEHRPEGWNVWLTFVVSPAEQKPTSTPKPRITK